MSNIIPYQEITQMANAIVKSGLFGLQSETQAIALMLIAQAEGQHPAIAARDYHIIQNKPALKADAMLARFQSQGGKVKFLELSDNRCAATFWHPSIESPVTIDWDINRAKRAEIFREKSRSGETGMWIKYPRQMLRARVISEGVRTVCPAACNCMYTPEEVIDIAESASETATAKPVNNTTPALPAPNDDGLISAQQAAHIFVLAKNSNVSVEKVKHICEKYGYSCSRDIRQADYDKICAEITQANTASNQQS